MKKKKSILSLKLEEKDNLKNLSLTNKKQNVKSWFKMQTTMNVECFILCKLNCSTEQ